MKNIVVIYSGDDWYREVPITSDHTRKSFEDWHNRGQEIGVNFFRASIDWYDESKSVFSKAWAFRDGEWKKITDEIKPDLVFDKVVGENDYSLFGRKIEMLENVPVFNNPYFRTIANSKLSQSLLFKEHMAQTYFVNNVSEYKELSEKIKGSKIVIKPVYGSGGAGIVIDEKEKINDADIKFPCVIQEFIESNNGIPGFSEKKEIADLRMIYLNHEFMYALSRIAKEGSYFTNFHQGAEAVIVPEQKIPASTFELADKIINKLKIFPQAHYSLDFIFKNDGQPLLVEMNTTPGFDLLYVLGDEKLMEKNFDKFIEVVSSIIENFKKN